MRDLFPEIEPYKQYQLKVSDLHEIHVEEVGNPEGHAIVFLHGGPGGGITPFYRRFFDPDHYRVILFDQRGCGRSTPHAELRENTTWDLVRDIELIKSRLGIKKWMVFGGSWGSTLALSYAITCPDSVDALVLRGIFLCRPKELQWFYQSGASKLFPDAWEKYIEPIAENDRHDLISAFYKKLTSPDKEIQIKAARAWSVWEASTSKLIPDQDLIEEFDNPEFAIAFARIECHYFINQVFHDSENWILENTDKIKDIPCVIVHGRYDVVCPIESAWALHKNLPNSELHIIKNAGHSMSEKGICDKLLETTEKFKQH